MRDVFTNARTRDQAEEILFIGLCPKPQTRNTTNVFSLVTICIRVAYIHGNNHTQETALNELAQNGKLRKKNHDWFYGCLLSVYKILQKKKKNKTRS